MRIGGTVSTLRALAATALAPYLPDILMQISGESFGDRDCAACERWAASR